MPISSKSYFKAADFLVGQIGRPFFVKTNLALHKT